MSKTSIDYEIVIEQFAERHFIKYFEKKYKGAWDATEEALKQEFRIFDVLFEKSIAETITDRGDVKICKTEFKISGSRESRHSSGNRCIVAVHRDTCTVHVLLVYHKSDLGNGNETARWKQIIKDNYPEYREML
jgi:hypothetical protein